MRTNPVKWCRCGRPFSGYVCDHCDRAPGDKNNPFTCTGENCSYCANYTELLKHDLKEEEK